MLAAMLPCCLYNHIFIFTQYAIIYYLLSYERMAVKTLPSGLFSRISLTVSKERNVMGVFLIGYQFGVESRKVAF